jgi:hypothetical protein
MVLFGIKNNFFQIITIIENGEFKEFLEWNS